jgi:hypothetical protein
MAGTPLGLGPRPALEADLRYKTKSRVSFFPFDFPAEPAPQTGPSLGVPRARPRFQLYHRPGRDWVAKQDRTTVQRDFLNVSHKPFSACGDRNQF